MKNKTFILCALVALTIGTPSCGKKKTTVAPETSPTPDASQKVESGPVVVKGFYIGMPAQDVKAVIQKSLAGFRYDTGSSKGNEWVYAAPENVVASMTENYTSQRYAMGMAGAVAFDIEGGKLTALWMGPLAMDYLFSTKELNASEVAKKFADSYHTPEFTHRTLPENSAVWVWDCTTSDNVLIRVTDDKFLRMASTGSGNPHGGFN